MASINDVVQEAREKAEALTHENVPKLIAALTDTFQPDSVMESYWADNASGHQKDEYAFVGCSDVPQKNGPFWDSNYIFINFRSTNSGESSMNSTGGIPITLHAPARPAFSPITHEGRMVGVYCRADFSEPKLTSHQDGSTSIVFVTKGTVENVFLLPGVVDSYTQRQEPAAPARSLHVTR